MIKIDDEYIINSNESCYTLESVNTVQDVNSKNFGKETRTIQGYYTSIESALNGYLKSKTRKYISQENTNTLYDLINYIKSLEKMLKDKIGGV